MKLNPQAIINAGLLSGGCCASGGIQVGTNVPSGIDNKHRFETEDARDAYFQKNKAELRRLTTIIIVGSDLQLWTGETDPEVYDKLKWNTMTWVIQGMQGVQGEQGVGIRRISAQVSQDQEKIELSFTMTDDSIKQVEFPVLDLLRGFEGRISSIEHRWGVNGSKVSNLNDTVIQGRFSVDETTKNKPDGVTKGFVDVYSTPDSAIQVLYASDGVVYVRIKGADWGIWSGLNSGFGDGDLLPSEYAKVLNSLSKRFPEISIASPDLNANVKQGRFCFNEQTLNKPVGVDHGSVDVYACKDFVSQVITTIDGYTYYRSYDRASSQWHSWLAKTCPSFPRVSSVFTTSMKVADRTRFSIPWHYVIHDTYGCTAPIPKTTPDNPEEQYLWWKCPKSGDYDMNLLLDISFITTSTTIPVMVNVTAYKKAIGGQEVELATYKAPLDVKMKNQTTKSINLTLENLRVGEMIRWELTFVGGSWSSSDNANASLSAFRTLLSVDEKGFDTAQRVAKLSYDNWANFYAQQGTTALVNFDSQQHPRLNAVKRKAEVVVIEADKGHQ